METQKSIEKRAEKGYTVQDSSRQEEDYEKGRGGGIGPGFGGDDSRVFAEDQHISPGSCTLPLWRSTIRRIQGTVQRS